METATQTRGRTPTRCFHTSVYPAASARSAAMTEVCLCLYLARHMQVLPICAQPAPQKQHDGNAAVCLVCSWDCVLYFPVSTCQVDPCLHLSDVQHTVETVRQPAAVRCNAPLQSRAHRKTARPAPSAPSSVPRARRAASTAPSGPSRTWTAATPAGPARQTRLRPHPAPRSASPAATATRSRPPAPTRATPAPRGTSVTARCLSCAKNALPARARGRRPASARSANQVRRLLPAVGGDKC
jgi:hypothetical protein